MVAQFPQIAHNVKNKSAEALSVWFLAEWLLVSLPFCFERTADLQASAVLLSKVYLLSFTMHLYALQGDTCNLIGCLLTGDQLITQTYTAMYGLLSDNVSHFRCIHPISPLI